MHFIIFSQPFLQRRRSFFLWNFDLALKHDFAHSLTSRSAAESNNNKNNNNIYFVGVLRRRNRRGRLVPTGKMPTEIRELDTKYFSLPDGRRLRTRISGQLRRKIQQYLWGRTACPVHRQWKDLGQRFWPRWLLEGHCPKGESSCSVPAGMYCRATGNQFKTLLRWHCRGASGPSAILQQYNSLTGAKATGSVNPIKVCQWIKVEYPVVTECGCGCATDVSE